MHVLSQKSSPQAFSWAKERVLSENTKHNIIIEDVGCIRSDHTHVNNPDFMIASSDCQLWIFIFDRC